MDFVCFSVNNWEKRKARKQQFMLHLSLRKDVSKVLYVEPPLNFLRLIALLFIELGTAENRRRWKRALLGRAEMISGKLFLLTPIFFIPFSFRSQFFYNINLFFVSIWLKGKLKRLNFTDIILWLYHPFDYLLLRWLTHRRLACFDWAEEWGDYFLEYSFFRKKAIKLLEEKIISTVDIVFVVSRILLEKAKAMNKHTYLLRDGTAIELFIDQKNKIPTDIGRIPHPIVGYGGTFYDRLDLDLIKEASEKLLDCSFVFVGSIQSDRVDISTLKNQKNIFFLGPKTYEELPDYLMNFDVCILPYVFSPLTSPPTKVYDYLATGRPIVSTALPELEDMRGLIKLADSKEKFIDFVKESLFETDVELSGLRKEKAGKNSWGVRADEIMQYLKDRTETKKS